MLKIISKILKISILKTLRMKLYYFGLRVEGCV